MQFNHTSDKSPLTHIPPSRGNNITATAWHHHWRWMFIILALIGLYGVVPQLGSVHQSLHYIRQAHLGPTLLAVLCIAGTYIAAAASYQVLAFRRLHFGRTVIAQLASMFLNRLLPAGLGGIGANYAYLRKAKHQPAQAGAVVAVNNTLGMIDHGLLIIGLLALMPGTIHRLHVGPIAHLRWIMTAVIGLLLVVVFVPVIRVRLGRALHGIGLQILLFRYRPVRLSLGLLCAVLITLCNVGCLAFCALALQTPLSFSAIFLVFSAGIAVGAAIPTPGGLGGVELGLVAALVSFHLTVVQAVAVTLLYRLISYWLALLVGALAFFYARRQAYF